MERTVRATDPMMPVTVTGISYKVAPVALRESLNLSPRNMKVTLLRLAERLGGEVLILSTCNRVEVYVCNATVEDARGTVLAEFCERSGIARPVLDACVYSHRDHLAVRHLFSVSSGLDSMLVGEPQILGQVRRAWVVAHECGTTGPGLSRLFQNALRVGKMARTRTKVAHYHISLGHATVSLAQQFFNGRGLSPQDILIIGAGEVAEMVARSLTVNGLGPMLVANRNFERAQTLAHALHGRAIRFSGIREALSQADVVISSSSAPHYVLSLADVKDVLVHRRGRPLCLVDIAVPRDVDPSVAALPGVCLYNIDDLQHLRGENLRRRQREADRAAALVAEETSRFMTVWRSLAAVPTVHRLCERAETIRQTEVERMSRRLPDLTPHQRESVSAMTKALVNKILHPTLAQIREPAAGPPCANYLDCISGFLGLETEKPMGNGQ